MLAGSALLQSMIDFLSHLFVGRCPAATQAGPAARASAPRQQLLHVGGRAGYLEHLTNKYAKDSEVTRVHERVGRILRQDVQEIWEEHQQTTLATKWHVQVITEA